MESSLIFPNIEILLLLGVLDDFVVILVTVHFVIELALSSELSLLYKRTGEICRCRKSDMTFAKSYEYMNSNQNMSQVLISESETRLYIAC